MTVAAGPSDFNTRWEDDIYAQGKQINRYPFTAFIGPFMSLFARADDRSRVRVAEIGCGAGNNVWFFAREGYAVEGIDGSAAALDYARRRLAAEGLGAKLIHGDFRRLPWPDASMDFVLDRGSITHNARDLVEAALDEARRVLKPGGHFFSQLFSAAHTDRRFAEDLSDGSASRFSGGYFAGIGRTYFADRADLDRLFGRRFEVKSMVHDIEENVLTGHINAMWNVLAMKTG